MTISRSTGTPVTAGGVLYGMAGGGYQGITDALDAVVRDAAEALSQAYRADIEIRFNSDRESGGAWLKTADGRNARVGICASLVTARQRASWEKYAAEYEASGYAEGAQQWRQALTELPEGKLTVFAHITDDAAGARRAELAQLEGWAEHTNGRGYHHGPAESVADALARCKDYAPAG